MECQSVRVLPELTYVNRPLSLLQLSPTKWQPQLLTNSLWQQYHAAHIEPLCSALCSSEFPQLVKKVNAQLWAFHWIPSIHMHFATAEMYHEYINIKRTHFFLFTEF